MPSVRDDPDGATGRGFAMGGRGAIVPIGRDVDAVRPEVGRAGAQPFPALTFALDEAVAAYPLGKSEQGRLGQQEESAVRGKIALGACLAGAVVVLVTTGAATAATVIALDEAVNDAPPQPRTMILDTDRLRMTSAQADVIFRGDLNKVWVLRPKDHSYIELTPGDMGQMGARMDQAMAQMKQKLASMPEAQRKQIEAMMAARGLGPSASPAAPRIAYEKAGDPRVVGQWSCAPYRMLLDGKASSEICVAKLSDLGLSRDDLKPFASFGAFMAHMTAAAGGLRSPMMAINLDLMTKALGFDGFPVEVVSKFGDGARKVVVTFKTVQHQDSATGAFDLPGGYAKRDIAGLGRPSAPE